MDEDAPLKVLGEKVGGMFHAGQAAAGNIRPVQGKECVLGAAYREFAVVGVRVAGGYGRHCFGVHEHPGEVLFRIGEEEGVSVFRYPVSRILPVIRCTRPAEGHWIPRCDPVPKLDVLALPHLFVKHADSIQYALRYGTGARP